MLVRDLVARGAILRIVGIGSLVMATVGGIAATPETVSIEPSQAAQTSQPSPRLNPFVHFENGSALFVGVDGRAASYVRSGEIFPLGIGLANQSKGSLSFNPESFVLEDEDGNRYPAVSREQFEAYRRSRIDQRLSDAFSEIMTVRHLNYDFAPWRPFPFSGELANPKPELELGRRQWAQATLYFPIPEGGIHGREFTLLVSAREFAEPFVVGLSIR